MTNERGFTLIEMLVALAVFSLAAMALLRLDSLAIRTSAELQDRAITRLVAQNEIAVLQTDPSAPAIGREVVTRINHGAQFAVVRDVRALPDPSMVAVTVMARRADGGAATRLTFVRAAGQP